MKSILPLCFLCVFSACTEEFPSSNITPDRGVPASDASATSAPDDGGEGDAYDPSFVIDSPWSDAGLHDARTNADAHVDDASTQDADQNVDMGVVDVDVGMDSRVLDANVRADGSFIEPDAQIQGDTGSDGALDGSEQTDVSDMLTDAQVVVHDVSVPEPDGNHIGRDPDSSVQESDAQFPLDPDMFVERDAAPLPEDVYVPPLDPREVDDDRDGYSEVQGDCDDAEPTMYPRAIERCHDELDNDCNGTADSIDPGCMGLSDTVVTVETQGARRAMILRVETYEDSTQLGGEDWQSVAEVINEARVSTLLPARQYQPNLFCGIRLNVWFYTDPGDVNADGQIEGEPNQLLCAFQAGVPTVDMTVRLVRIEVNGEFYDAGNLVPWVHDDGIRCSALLVLNDQGACALE